MWTESEVQSQLIDKGFMLKGQTTVVGLEAHVYEKVTAIEGHPGDALAGQYETIQRVLIGESPFGLDLGEEAFNRDSEGTVYPIHSRIYKLLEVVDASAVPTDAFVYPYPIP
jgi:hypothetical protein